MQQPPEALTQKLSRSERSLVVGLSPSLVELDPVTLLGRARGAFARLTDRQAATAVGAVLFVLCAWPVALTQVPPLQDLPNHLAAVTVIKHPELYPEFVSNGFFKTNAALFSWLYFVGGLIGTNLAARTFALLVLGANALVLPHFFLQFTNRKRMLVASLLAWPMVHNWFVSMGMLDFALGVPLSLLLLMAVDVHRRSRTLKSGALVFALSFATWYSHVFALLVVGLLQLIQAASTAIAAQDRSRGSRIEAIRTFALELFTGFVPQVPALGLTAWSLYVQLTEPTGAMHGFVALQRLLPPWELFYNMFAEWMYGFTWLSVTALVPTLAIPLLAFSRRWEGPKFFGPAALIALFCLYFATPYVATNWFHVNSRFIGFIFVALLLRVPERINRRFAVVLAACAVLYSAGMGVDYVRLDNDRAKVTAGISAVPEGARLLPLIFNQKATSENTRSVLHTWGYYVTEKQTSAPLLFAHSRSFPVMYRDPPPIQFNHLVLEAFAPTMSSPAWECNILRVGGIVEPDCVATWRERWALFWRDATPRFDHVLMWDAPREVTRLVPPNYRLKFSQERLSIYERVDTNDAPAAANEVSPSSVPSGLERDPQAIPAEDDLRRLSIAP